MLGIVRNFKMFIVSLLTS